MLMEFFFEFSNLFLQIIVSSCNSCSLNAGRPAERNWGKAVIQSSSAQVKVASLVKTAVKNNTEPARKKRRKIHPSGFEGKGK